MGGREVSPGLALGPDPEPDPSSVHLKGDDQVEVLPHFADVSLAEVARKPDLGLLWGYRHRNGGSMLGWGTLEGGTERQRQGRSRGRGGGPNDDMARAGQTTATWSLGERAQRHLRTISRMVTGWNREAGSLRPAMLTATTRNKIFAPVGRFLTVKPQRSMGSVLAGIQSSATKE